MCAPIEPRSGSAPRRTIVEHDLKRCGDTDSGMAICAHGYSAAETGRYPVVPKTVCRACRATVLSWRSHATCIQQKWLMDLAARSLLDWYLGEGYLGLASSTPDG